MGLDIPGLNVYCIQFKQKQYCYGGVMTKSLMLSCSET